MKSASSAAGRTVGAVFLAPFAGYVFAKLLPPYTGEGDKNYARSLRRRLAVVGLVMAVGLTAFLWDWTANVVAWGGVFLAMMVGLWLLRRARPSAGGLRGLD